MKEVICKKPKATKLAACMLLVILCTFMLAWTFQTSYGINESSPLSPWAIDLFTQHNPHNGKGLNQSSGAYAPFEEVTLYTNITYSGAPQANVFVSFQVIGPLNSSHPFMLFRSAATNKDGTASISFRTPLNEYPDESVVGVWQAFSSAKTPEPIEDSLTFEVAWPIEISLIKFLNEEGNPQSRFARGEPSTVQLTLRNNALYAKNINLTLMAKDSAQTQIEQMEIQNIRLEGNSETQIEHKLSIPTWAAFGEGKIDSTVYSGLYEDMKIRASEPKTTQFSVITRGVAIAEAHLPQSQLYVGEPLSINLKAENRGNETEELHININYDGGSIGKLTITLAALDSENLTYTWNTSEVAEGKYTLTAEVEKVPWETELEDNKITVGEVKVNYRPVFPYAVHLFVLVLVITGIFTFSLLLALWKRQYTNQGEKDQDFSSTQNEPKRTLIETELSKPKKSPRRKSSRTQRKIE